MRLLQLVVLPTVLACLLAGCDSRAKEADQRLADAQKQLAQSELSRSVAEQMNERLKKQIETADKDASEAKVGAEAREKALKDELDASKNSLAGLAAQLDAANRLLKDQMEVTETLRASFTAQLAAASKRADEAETKLGNFLSLPLWTYKSSWLRVANGMSTDEVRAALGPPPAKSTVNLRGDELWRYSENGAGIDEFIGIVKFRDGKVTEFHLPSPETLR